MSCDNQDDLRKTVIGTLDNGIKLARKHGVCDDCFLKIMLQNVIINYIAEKGIHEATFDISGAIKEAIEIIKSDEYDIVQIYRGAKKNN